MAHCHRNRENCTETSGVIETGRAPIRDHKDTEMRSFFFIIKVTRSNPPHSLRGDPGFMPGPHLYPPLHLLAH